MPSSSSSSSSSSTTAVSRSASNGISALISGAGVGGLVAALELWRNGCHVRVFEKAPASSTAGDTFQIGPSAMRFLKHWPEMSERHAQIAYQPLFALCKHTGERRGPPRDFSQMVQEKSKSKTKSSSSKKDWYGFQHSRPKFHAMLLEQVEKCGIVIEFGRDVVDYFEDAEGGKGGAVLRDGWKVEADVVVAAEGWHGKSWGLIAGRPVPARSSGTAIFRAAYPLELALRDPMIAERFKVEEDGRTVFELWTGENMFGTFWRSDESMMWSITHPDHGTAEESWSNRIDTEHVLNFTSTIPGWPEVADRVVRATPTGELIDWKLMWRDPQPNWVSPAGYVVQLGDAAHTFLPSSGNGATQAIEDAVSLAACVATARAIPDATRVHNLLRFERVSYLQAMGVARSKTRIQADGSTKVKDPPMPGAWLWEHDAEGYVEEKFEEARQHLRDPTKPFLNTNRPTTRYIPWTIDGLVEALEKGEPTVLDGDWS